MCTSQAMIRAGGERSAARESLGTGTEMQLGQGRQSNPEKSTAKAADRAEGTLGCQKLQSPSHKPQDKPNSSCSHNCLTSSCLTLAGLPSLRKAPGTCPALLLAPSW